MEEESYDSLPDEIPYNLQKKIPSRISEYEELHLKYTYSGMSNASSCNDFMLSTARSFNEEYHVKFNFVESQKLFESITKIVNELQQKMNIHNDLIIYLLYQYKWNTQKLQQIYYDQDVLKYKEMNEKIHKNNIKQYGNKKQKCEVCLEERELYHSFFCQHSYCKKCWEQYFQQNLSNNKIFFNCMDFRCNQCPIILEFVSKIAPNLFQNYLKKICINYSMTNKTISYCPSDSCNYFCEKQPTIQQNYIECPCGMRYCFKCEKEPHEPAFCTQVQIWGKLTNRQTNNQNWIQKYTKKCPQCKQYVEKYVGCNYVKCICGCEFCFNCIVPWNHSHKTNPEHCLLKKPSVSQKDIKIQKEQQFEQLLDKSIFISRSMNKSILIIRKTEELVNQTQNLCYLKQILTDIKGQVHHCWTNVKWSLISLFIRKQKSIQIELEKDVVKQIKNLVEVVERIQNKISKSFMKSMSSQQFISLKQELLNKKQKMFRNIQVFSLAWKHQTGQEIE